MVKVVWLIESKQGNLTIEQEFFCWRMALHGNKMKSVRESYSQSPGNDGFQNTKAYRLLKKPKIVRRIKRLVNLHKKGEVDLNQGPWMHYDRHDIGNEIDPGNGVTHLVNEIRRKEYGGPTLD